MEAQQKEQQQHHDEHQYGEEGAAMEVRVSYSDQRLDQSLSRGWKVGGMFRTADNTSFLLFRHESLITAPTLILISTPTQS